MNYDELESPIHRKFYRILKNGWIDRQSLAEQMFLFPRQVSALINTLRNKGINITARPHPESRGCKQYKLGEITGLQTRKDSSTTNTLLVMEMNHIRMLAEQKIDNQQYGSGIVEIKQIAERALEGCGLLTETTKLD